MPNIFLVPAHPDNLKVTIKIPVNLTVVQQHLPPDKFNELLSKIPQGGHLYCWAFKMGQQNVNLYRTMQEGDSVLFKPSKTGQITHEGIVCYKYRSAALANVIWPVKAKSPWELIYFLCNVRRLDINYPTFKARLGFAPNFAGQQTVIISNERIRLVEQEYGSFQNFLNKLSGTPTNAVPIKSSPNVIIRKVPRADENAPDIVSPQSPKKYEPDKALLKGLAKLDDDIEALKIDREHKERAHEDLVQKFFKLLGYMDHTEIKFQQGRIDISIEMNGKPLIVIEVKKDWSLTKEDKKALQQAFNYSNDVGARFVIVTNGDYYAVYDKSKGWSYNDSFIGEFSVSDFQKIDYQILACLKK